MLSGQLVAPELPELVERTEMTDLVDTYGKTIHTWQIDRGDKLPFGAGRYAPSRMTSPSVDATSAELQSTMITRHVAPSSLSGAFPCSRPMRLECLSRACC